MESEIRAGRYFGKEECKEKTFAEFIDRYIEKELPKNPKGYAKQKMLLAWWKNLSWEAIFYVSSPHP